VVISADHEHNTIWDIITGGFSSDSLMDSLADRPDDVRFLLDTVLDMNDDPEDRFYGLMDPDKIGATGHSAGALTALSLPCLDDRFDVAVLHSPHIHGGFAFGGCQTLPYPVPTLTMGGTLDHTINYCLQYCGYRELLVGPPSYLYELTGGGHFTFADICQLNLVEVAKELDLGSTAEGFLRDGCGDENVSYAKAHKTINYYATAFLDAHLRGNPASLEALVDRDDPPFDVVRFFTGEVPDFPDGGCGDCSIF
jgi:predicted dienelactone hydrolase